MESQVVGKIAILRVHGTLTANPGERGLREMIREAFTGGARTVVVNLEEATTIDSSGVSDLASGHMLLRGSGGALKLCGLSKKLKDLFAVTRLNAVFETHETEAAALDSVQAK